MNDYLLGLYFGSVTDHSELVLSSREENPEAFNEGEPLHKYELVHIEQLPLGLTYPQIIDYVDTFVQQKELKNRVQIAADCTGVGKAVLDLLRSNPALSDITWSIIFTSGQNVTSDGMLFKVPKKDLIAAVLILTGRGLLTCSSEVAQSETSPSAKCSATLCVSLPRAILSTTPWPGCTTTLWSPCACCAGSENAFPLTYQCSKRPPKKALAQTRRLNVALAIL